MGMVIRYLDYTLEVEYDYEPEESMVWRDSDGSGHPGSPAIVDMYSCKFKDTDIYPLLSCKAVTDIEELILKYLKQNE